MTSTYIPGLGSLLDHFTGSPCDSHPSQYVGNEVCPNTEHEKINSGTTGTENTHIGTNDTTDDVDQT